MGDIDMDILTFLRYMITPLLINLALSFVLFGIMSKNDKALIENAGKEVVKIYKPKVNFYIALVGGSISGFLFVKMLEDDDQRFIVILLELCMFFFTILALYLAVSTLVLKIVIFKGEPYFRYRNLFGITTEIPYDQCEYYTLGENIIKLKTTKKTYYFDNKAICIDFLIAELRRKKIKVKPRKTWPAYQKKRHRRRKFFKKF